MRNGILILALGLFCASESFAADTLFKYKGKAYTAKDLTVPEQQQLYDVQFESYAKTVALIDQLLLNLHVAELAKKSGKSAEKVEEELFASKDPTDDEVKAWYEKNKAMIPEGYTFDQVKGQIKTYIKESGGKEKRDALVEKLRKEKGTEIALVEPVAPVLDLKTDGYPVKGKASAKITLVEFADYQCPHCKAASEWLAKLLTKYDGKVKLVFIDYPLKGELSNKIAEGGYCAEQQGKYWEYNALAFAKQEPLHHEPNAFDSLAKDLKLDEAKFKSCLGSPEAKKRVASGKAEGDRIGITGTPSIYINGKRLKGANSDDIEREIERALKAGQS